MLAEVRQRFLDRPEHGDALSRRERVRVTANFELRIDAGALRESVALAVEDLSGRTAEHALRLERMRELPKLSVEVDETGGEIIEPSVSLLAVLLEHERVHLLLEEPNVGCKRQNVLNRDVVQVEPDSHQTTLCRCGERSLPS